MSPTPAPDLKKALKHETKGDKLASKGKFRQALEEYQKSESYAAERPEIYEKLVQTLNQLESQWSEQDFSDAMTWTMRQQEILHPEMRRVHETFSVEYKEVQKLIQRLMVSRGDETENKLIDEILSYGDRASLPMLHFLLSLKAIAVPEPAEAPPDSFSGAAERP